MTMNRSMNLRTAITLLALAFLVSCAADESDSQMPRIVARAGTRVNVRMVHIESTDRCFPDSDTQVRFIGGRVVTEDFKLYKNHQPDLSEGLVAFELNGKWGACDKDGKVILPAKFESAFEFHEGLAGVQEGGKLGFIDKKGRWAIKPRFDADYTRGFIGRVCPVRIDGKRAVIDKTGKYVWKPGLLRSESLGGGVFIQTKDGREGFLDDSGRLIPNQKPNPRYYDGE